MLKQLLALTLLVSLFSCRQENTIALFEAGQQSAFSVVFTSRATLPQAQELAFLLGQSTSVPIEEIKEIPQGQPYILLKTEQENAPLNPLQSGRIGYQMQDDHLVIEASDSVHLYYAVYEFLERELGYRWLDAETTVIPALEGLALSDDLNYSYSPPIATRTVHARAVYENPEFARHMKVTTSAFPNYAPDARVHTFHRFLPREHFLDAHPEYYAFRDGRRISTQLCLTNTDVLDIVRDSVQAHFDRHPEALVVSVSTDDNTQYCTCPQCQQSDAQYGGPTGTLLNFVNQVAAKFPDKFISTLAYQYTRKPGTVKPADNVLITLCSIECDRSGPIEEKCSAFAEDMQAWNEMDATLRIWDYTTQFTNFLAPFPNLRTLQPNIQFFRNSGAKWVFEQHSNNPSDLYDLRIYLMSKLLWNPDADVEALITDFTDPYYGAGGEHIRQYITDLHNALEADPDFFLFLYGDPSQAFNSFLSAEKLGEYHKSFRLAEAAVATDEVALQRINRAGIGLDYATLEACRKNISAEFSLLGEDGQLSPVFRATLDRFKTTCDKHNITLMNEMGYTVEEYLSDWEETISLAFLPNLAGGKPIELLTEPKKYADEDPQVLTDGAFGGASFYANWLGFEGNHLEAIIDLGSVQKVSYTNINFLQVVNHLVFFPTSVTYSYAGEDKMFKPLGRVENERPLTPNSKVNDTQRFELKFPPVQARYLKVKANNLLTPPDWHHGAGLPSWIFADEWLAL